MGSMAGRAVMPIELRLVVRKWRRFMGSGASGVGLGAIGVR
jgi:hypothetical protein